MKDLDDLKQIEELDISKMRDSIAVLYKQCEQAWQESTQVQVPKDYKNVNKVVVSGMGGSSLGPEIIKTIFIDNLKVPVILVNNYELPECVDDKTLLLLSSYSGTTEETLEAYGQGKAKNSKILGITTGGKLAEILLENNLPFYKINPEHNPCGQPRMALGYSIFGILGLLRQVGLISFEDKQAKEIINMLKNYCQGLNVNVDTEKNLAKQVANKLYNKIPAIVASEFLAGNAHACANQINENAKNFSFYYILPELNHHLMEGLAHPKEGNQNLCFVLFKSNLYRKEIQIRYNVTVSVLNKNNINHLEIDLKQDSNILQSFEMLQFGGWVAFYLAMLNGINPSPIPYVDYFKEELAKLK